MALPAQLKDNQILTGVIWGVLIPFIGVALLMILDEAIVDMDLALPNNNIYLGQKSRTLFLLAICLNLIPFQIFRNRRMDKALRGIGLVTITYAIIWFFYFSSTIL